MTDLNLTALRAIAEAATPGPWKHDGNINSPWMWSTFQWGGCDRAIFKCGSFADAEHVQAFNPAQAIALLDRIELLERLLGEACGLASGMQNLACDIAGSNYVGSEENRLRLKAIREHGVRIAAIREEMSK